MTAPGTSVEELLAQAVPGQQVVVHFADGSAVQRGGYRSVESALFGPLGVQHCFQGTPSPGLQHEINGRGQALIAAVGAAGGTTLLIDGLSVWAADLAWDPAPSLETLLAQRTQAQLLGGPGVPPEAQPTPAPEPEPVGGPSAAAERSPDAAGPDRAGPNGGRPPPPARPRRPASPARPPERAVATAPSTGSAEEAEAALTPAPEPAAGSGDGGDWVDRVLAAEPVRVRAGRRRLSAADIRRLLQVLDRHGTSGVPFTALAQEAGVAERRVPGYLAQLSEIVNIDGYEVITVSAQSARFDRALLERQLRVGL